MLLVKLENEKETVVILNGDFTPNQLRKEWELYVATQKNKEQTELLLQSAKTLSFELVITLEMTTKVIAQSAHAEEARVLKRGDKVTVYSNATYKVKKSFWSRLLDVFRI